MFQLNNRKKKHPKWLQKDWSLKMTLGIGHSNPNVTNMNSQNVLDGFHPQQIP